MFSNTAVTLGRASRIWKLCGNNIHGNTKCSCVRHVHAKQDEVGRLTPCLPPGRSKKIYILGVGNIGSFFAHALATQTAPPPITLLLHRPGLTKAWGNAGHTIAITTHGIKRTGGIFDTELIQSMSPGDATVEAHPTDHIDNLIVATKTFNTAVALSSIKHRLSRASTLLFTQNGMGTMEEVSRAVFPHAATRPTYLACVATHAIYTQGAFSYVLAGPGSVSIGAALEQQQDNEDALPSHLQSEIIRAPLLATALVSPGELALQRLEKLVVNTMINPLTAIFNRRNGELFRSAAVQELMMAHLLREAGAVIRALPELRTLHDSYSGNRSSADAADTQCRFAQSRLQSLVLRIGAQTAENTSSMLQDVRAGRETEINYLNGWLVRRGEEVGVKCENHAVLVRLVKEGKTIGEKDIGKYFPGVEGGIGR